MQKLTPPTGNVVDSMAELYALIRRGGVDLKMSGRILRDEKTLN